MSEAEAGVISHQPLLDLSHLTSPEQLAAITRIERVAVVVVPEALAATYAAIPSSRVACTVFVPPGVRVRVHTGPLSVSGDGLGGPDDVLVVIGMLVVTSPVTGPLPQRISVVGSVLAPRGSESALGPVLGGGSGGVSYYRHVEGQDVKLLTGQVKLSSATLANADGQPGDLMVIAGQAIVTGPVSKVGYGQVFVAGQLVAPEASRDALEPRLQVQGQAVWYKSDEVKIIGGDARLGPDYFRLLERPVSLVVLGDLTIAPGVPEALILEKVSDVVLLGDLIAPAALVDALQVRMTDAFGDIRISDGPGS
jgi:hypothetical protein